MPAARGVRPSAFLSVLCAILGATALAPGSVPTAGHGMTGSPIRDAEAAAGLQAATEGDAVEAGEEAARRLCVTCHRFSPPEVLPRSLWRDEILRMHLIMTGQPADTQIETLPPDMEAIARYYEAMAPEQLPRPAPWPGISRKVRFARRNASLDGGETLPAVAHVRLVNLHGDARLEVVASDMRAGTILAANPYDEQPVLRVIARTPHPAHIEPIDFDGDGILDFLVGDLGSFLPMDHDRGAVVWLRGQKDGNYIPLSLDGWPRVSDVRAADFDGSGKLDLAVAAFGWRTTGHFTILRNETVDYSSPSFAAVRVDGRSGAINVVPADLDEDGLMDFVVLFAQEHETVVAFLNRGYGAAFEPRTIYTAPHPNWGSSRIELVDLDQDGDLDVILTNGDTFDDEITKPYHGITWLENRGTFPFTEHRLADMAGVHQARAADLDGDGDLDIVACALLSAGEEDTKDLPSLIWLEQTRPGVFERHTLEVGFPRHASLDVSDFDRDGDPDIVVGNFRFGGGASEAEVQVWENQRIRRRK